MKLVIASGFCYIIGNIVHRYFDCPEMYWIPLSVFLFALIREAKMNVNEKGFNYYAIEFLELLSVGNIIKQVFYSESISQINDYFFGAMLTLIYLYKYIVWKIYTSRQNCL